MANYVIEGTVTELKMQDNTCTFKINGTEGYSVKHEKEKYNILYSNDIKDISEKKYITSYVVLQTKTFKSDKIDCNVFATAMASGKKLLIEGTFTDELESDKSLNITSITLLDK